MIKITHLIKGNNKVFKKFHPWTSIRKGPYRKKFSRGGLLFKMCLCLKIEKDVVGSLLSLNIEANHANIKFLVQKHLLSTNYSLAIKYYVYSRDSG